MKKMVVIGLIAFIFILVIFYFIFKSNKECVPFTGGSFSIIFNTNGGDEISSMSVCIACSPDSYLDLPVPVRDGYVFDGWYYDNGLSKMVESTNSIDIKPIPQYDNNCTIGYKDIEIYAKWVKK